MRPEVVRFVRAHVRLLQADTRLESAKKERAAAEAELRSAWDDLTEGERSIVNEALDYASPALATGDKRAHRDAPAGSDAEADR